MQFEYESSSINSVAKGINGTENILTQLQSLTEIELGNDKLWKQNLSVR